MQPTTFVLLLFLVLGHVINGPSPPLSKNHQQKQQECFQQQSITDSWETVRPDLLKWIRNPEIQREMSPYHSTEYKIIHKLAEDKLSEAQKAVNSYFGTHHKIDPYFVALLHLIKIDNNDLLAERLLSVMPCPNVNAMRCALLEAAVASKTNYIFYLDMLWEKGLNLETGNARFELLSACRQGKLEAIRWFESKGMDLRYNNDLPFRVAAKAGQLPAAQLLKRRGALVTANNNSALVMTCMEGHIAMVQWLLYNGADVNANEGEPLAIAARHGRINLVQYLMAEHDTNPCMFGKKAWIFAKQARQMDILQIFDAYILQHCPSTWQLLWMRIFSSKNK
jgi:hypothetical protein